MNDNIPKGTRRYFVLFPMPECPSAMVERWFDSWEERSHFIRQLALRSQAGIVPISCGVKINVQN